jgi:hypothetical protein
MRLLVTGLFIGDFWTAQVISTESHDYERVAYTDEVSAGDCCGYQHHTWSLKTKLRGFGPLANYADRATAACWRCSANFCGIEGVAWSAQRIPTFIKSLTLVVLSAVKLGGSKECWQRMGAVPQSVLHTASAFPESFRSVPPDSSSNRTFLLYHSVNVTVSPELLKCIFSGIVISLSLESCNV